MPGVMAAEPTQHQQ